MIKGSVNPDRVVRRDLGFRTLEAATRAIGNYRKGTEHIIDTFAFLVDVHEGYHVAVFGRLTARPNGTGSAVVDFDDWTLRRAGVDHDNAFGTSLAWCTATDYAK